MLYGRLGFDVCQSSSHTLDAQERSAEFNCFCCCIMIHVRHICMILFEKAGSDFKCELKLMKLDLVGKWCCFSIGCMRSSISFLAFRLRQRLASSTFK